MTTSKLFSRPVAFRSTEDATGPTSAACIQTLGGINIKKGAYIGNNCIVGGNMAVSSTTPATSLGQAAVALNGGLSVAQGLIVSGTGTIGSPFGITLLPSTNARQCSIDFHTLSTGAVSSTNAVWTLGNNVSPSTDSTFCLKNSNQNDPVLTVSADTGDVSFNGTTDSTAPNNGSVRVMAGLGVGGTAQFNLKANFLSGADFGNQRVTGVAMPQDPMDAASRMYVDNAIQGLDIKDSVKVASTTAVNLNDLIEGYVIDTVTLIVGQRILMKDQTDPTENGIYIIGTTAPPERPPDFNVGDTVSGAFVFVEDGHVNVNGGFVCVSAKGEDIVGTYPILWTQFAGAGSVAADQPRIRYIGSTDDATSSTSGGLVVSGGLAVTKSIRAGDDIYANAVFKVATEDWVLSQTYAKAAQSNLIQFVGANNVSTPIPVTGLVLEDFFNQDVLVRIVTGGSILNQLCTLVGYITQTTSKVDQTSYGDDTGIEFTVDNTGQIYYTLPSIPDWSSTTMYWKVIQKTTVVVDPNATSDSTSVTTGSTVFKGGIAVQKNLYVGQDVHADGNIRAEGTITQGSDERLKTDISYIDDALSLVKKIKGVRYISKLTGERCIGVVAQDVADVVPEVVRERNDGMLSVAYGNMVGLLINAVKELAAQVEELTQSRD